MWLTHTVRVAAQSSPSLALRCSRLGTPPTAPSARSPRSRADLRPRRRRLAARWPRRRSSPDTPGRRSTRTSAVSLVVPWVDVADSAVHEPRTGLHGAQLVSVTVPELDAQARPADAAAALADWDLLTGAVARRASPDEPFTRTQTYVTERQQFGAPDRLVRRPASPGRRHGPARPTSRAGASRCVHWSVPLRARTSRPRQDGPAIDDLHRRDPGARRLRLHRRVSRGRPAARRDQPPGARRRPTPPRRPRR